MSQLVLSLPRRILPRWRAFNATSKAGELSLISKETPRLSLDADLAGAIQTWKQSKSIETAGELLATALYAEDPEMVKVAAEFLMHKGDAVPPIAHELASDAMSYLDTDGSSPQRVSIANKVDIRSLRKMIQSSGQSAIAWAELALAYANIGKKKASIRAMATALALANDDRFILRSATRCFVHWDEADRAIQVLNRSERTKKDPWLIAAHVAVSEVLNRSSKFFKEGRKLIERGGITDKGFSELGAALGSQELKSGEIKMARKFFNRSLNNPTENAVAQVMWAFPGADLGFVALEMKLPLGFEANARAHIARSEWSSALTNAKQWHADEPFASRASLLASFIAAAVLEKYDDAITIAKEGLQSNPDSILLANNLAFGYAKNNEIEKARRMLQWAMKQQLTENQKMFIVATEGLVAFRSGDADLGRRLYREAASTAEILHDDTSKCLATIFLAEEEIRLRAPGAEMAVKAAEEECAESNVKEVEVLVQKLRKKLLNFKEDES